MEHDVPFPSPLRGYLDELCPFSAGWRLRLNSVALRGKQSKNASEEQTVRTGASVAVLQRDA